MTGVEGFIVGAAFEDAVVVLHILRNKLQWEKETKPDPLIVLPRVDDFLGLVGMAGISVTDLWRNADSSLVSQQDPLWSAVRALLGEASVGNSDQREASLGCRRCCC